MEWSKAKSLLILLMLAVNIYLGVNIYTQIRAEQVQEARMVEDACALLRQQGIVFSEEELSALPHSLQSWIWVRDTGAERQAALRLLGECREERPGGGIYTYTGVGGTVTFRSGGYVELLPAVDTRHELSALLDPQAEDSLLEICWEDEAFTLRFDSCPVLGARVERGEAEAWNGTWIFASEPQAGEAGLSRAGLVLAAGRLLKSVGHTALEEVECVYMLTSLQSGDIRLVPALVLQTDGGELCMNALTGEAMAMPQK